MKELYLVFDVESVGLHGEGFAVGYVVVDGEGKLLAYDILAVEPSTAQGSDEGRAWIAENVLPALPSWMDCDPLGLGFDSPRQVRRAFWKVWLEWKEKGALLVSDCAWPVEARFLAQCVDDAVDERKWEGPYPLIDVSSVLLAVGKDPIGTYERLSDELPAHNPLCDARQSARVFIETLKEQRERLKALAFAASVIKSGEPWTATCERVIGGALKRASNGGMD